jgi:hypothetical protein
MARRYSIGDGLVVDFGYQEAAALAMTSERAFGCGLSAV